jgi:hypothetical protein
MELGTVQLVPLKRMGASEQEQKQMTSRICCTSYSDRPLKARADTASHWITNSWEAD